MSASTTPTRIPAGIPAVIPVLDVRGGIVVQGRAGRRDEYRPIVSPLANTADPILLARAIRDRYGLTSLYLADLDGIEHGLPQLAIVEQLARDGWRLLVDPGIRTPADARRLLSAGAQQVIAALETSPGPSSLAELTTALTPGQLVFSLDLLAGQPLLAKASAWGGLTPIDIALFAIAEGVTSLLILDLSGVGVSHGIATLPLCRELRERCPHAQLFTGGGVCSNADLTEAATAGVDAVLVATALHEGRLTIPA